MLHVFLYVTVRIGQNLLNEVPVESSILADFPNYYFKASNGNFNEPRNFFMPRVTNNNLRGRGLNVSQPSYNNRFMHNFFSYSIAHVWNNLPFSTKSAPTFQQFRLLIYKVTVMSEQYFVALIYCKLYVLIILHIYIFAFCILYFFPRFFNQVHF